MKLICEVNDSIQAIVEEKDNNTKNYFIEGIFMQADQKNKNGRIYPMNIMEKEVDRYNKEYVKSGRAFGELGHPDGPTINLERVSHMIKELRKDGSNFIGKAKVMDTPYGKIVKNLIDEGATLGVSTRGMGSLKNESGANIVQDDFYLATAGDIVADPSAPNAFVEGIMEGKEWVWDNGIIKEVYINHIKNYIEKSSARKLKEENKVNAFQMFLSKL